MPQTAGGWTEKAELREALIFFTLLVLLALCIVVAQVVIQDVDANLATAAGPRRGEFA